MAGKLVAVGGGESDKEVFDEDERNFLRDETGGSRGTESARQMITLLERCLR